MTTEIAKLYTTNTDHVERGITFLTRCLKSQQNGQDEVDACGRIVAALNQPAHPAQVMARIGALLEPYYDKGTPVNIKKIEFQDWADEIAEYPQWAIDRACKWWKSSANEDRRKRPLEGDIASRVKIEMGAVRAFMVRPVKVEAVAEIENRPEVTVEDRERRKNEADAIMRSVFGKDKPHD